MVSEDWISRAIQAGRTYEQLPARVRSALPIGEWKARVKDHCIQHGYAWGESPASTSCGEQEYYEDLLAYYKQHEWLFPYHLAGYICRVLRTTAFRYYFDTLYASLKEERAYDRIPNFAAADIVRKLGIGRNEYIAILDSCKAKKLLWRVNKGIAKEMLPSEPLNIPLEPWWKVSVVNVSEPEFRVLSSSELDLLQGACQPQGVTVSEADQTTLRSLYKRGLVYFTVPIKEDDHFTIPPLEGFVSNKNTVPGEGVDPMESLLYSIFVANSESCSVGDLARVLNVNVSQVQAAMGVACRLGFVSRVPRDSDKDGAAPSYDSVPLRDDDEEVDSSSAKTQDSGHRKDNTKPEEGSAVALIVDAETTSYLMMGALSPAVKKHAVTLFEGGRVAGDDTIEELISELRLSASAHEQLGGEMVELTQHTTALVTALDCVKAASGGRSIELLRRESLAGLSHGAIHRVLSHAYKVVVPVAPLPGEVLPLGFEPEEGSSPGPVFFGPAGPVSSPWFQLAVYTVVGAGPVSMVFLHGQRLHKLPGPAASCRSAFVRPWGAPPDSALLVSQPFLIFYLNEMLRKGAVVLQPLLACERERAQALEGGKLDDLGLVDIPLPFVVLETEENKKLVQGFERPSGKAVELNIPLGLEDALHACGLDSSVGFVKMIDASWLGSSSGEWLPLEVHLGLPLHSVGLCKAVCDLATEGMLFDAQGRDVQIKSQKQRVAIADRLMGAFGGGWGGAGTLAGSLPATNFMFDGSKVVRADFSSCIQGSGSHSAGNEVATSMQPGVRVM
ncbi:unnamed protein product [Ostreobium quekettii]|uniref:Protein FAM91A1 n=1 Tax=Ostreobium quekettii TaxID=121088 RepID=A0A8S1IPX6_9CHLO|nr:unnamed protein product [Ostreobium quekettii]|eukprot:evm.model.scf_707.9 EVM.evm.TU.scf_707.9   scf_707:52053-59603(+)